MPSHFPSDEHGLGFFDGTHLFEHADPRKGFHPDWKSLIFNYDRYEVRSFLLSSAHFWLDRYHADGLRVDAVASMLYLDYSREAGEWIPNEHGGNENLGALRFLKQLNETVYADFPDVQTFAEESTAWPMVSRPTDVGGLGFGLKWDMGWMHDTLDYFERDPIHRRYAQDELTFRMVYAFTENFTLPLSHDEVVHGKGSLLSKMPGDRWQQLANLRALFGYQYGQPGKKLLFMGDDLAVGDGVGPRRPAAVVAARATRARRDPALGRDAQPAACAPSRRCTSSTSIRPASSGSTRRTPRPACCRSCAGPAATSDGTPVDRRRPRRAGRGQPHPGAPLGLRGRRARPAAGGPSWPTATPTTTAAAGWGNLGGVDAVDRGRHGRPFSLPLTLPPLSVVFLAPERAVTTADSASRARVGAWRSTVTRIRLEPTIRTCLGHRPGPCARRDEEEQAVDTQPKGVTGPDTAAPLPRARAPTPLVRPARPDRPAPRARAPAPLPARARCPAKRSRPTVPDPRPSPSRSRAVAVGPLRPVRACAAVLGCIGSLLIVALGAGLLHRRSRPGA